MTARIRTKLLSALVFVSASLMISGCNTGGGAPAPAPRENNNRQADIEHRVQYSGETLQVISAWYTGRGSNWQLIRAANPGLRPERINMGKTIVIPGNLVVERRPMPQNFLRDAINRSPARRPDATAPTEAGPQGQPIGTTDLIGKDTTAPTETTPPSDEVDLDAILKQQIEEQKKVDEPSAVEPTPNPTPSAARIDEPVKNEPVKAADAPAANPEGPAAGGDAEREKLLDELLTQ